MATQKQIEANRRNALLSTGPRTDLGKMISRMNAQVHGCASSVVYRALRHEKRQDFHVLRQGLMDSWKPINSQEINAVDLIASAYKRIQRSEAMEASFFNGMMDSTQRKHKRPEKPTGEDDLGCAVVMGDPKESLSWDNIDRYRTKAWNDFRRATDFLLRVRKERRVSERDGDNPEHWADFLPENLQEQPSKGEIGPENTENDVKPIC